MKVLIVSTIYALGASVATAHAQGAPWCLQSDAFDGDRSGSYATFQQCLIDRNYLDGLCVQTSTYRPPASQQSSARRYRYIAQ
jgi:hypothetical protein